MSAAAAETQASPAPPPRPAKQQQQQRKNGAQQPPQQQQQRKLRILCLHGYMQNAEIFKSRLGSMRKALKSKAEFVFMDAPYVCEEPAAGSPEQEEEAAEEAPANGEAAGPGRSWWRWSDVEPGTRPSRAAQYSGWEASQAAVEAALAQRAPVDVLLGFSQGATATALFLAHQQQPQQQQQSQLQRQQQQQGDSQQQSEAAAPGPASAPPPTPLRGAVLVAGFLPRDPAYSAALTAAAPMLRSLHVTGAGDELVPEERSAALRGCWHPAARVDVYRHPGRHMVPTCSGEFKAALLRFLEGCAAEQEGGLSGGEGAAAGERVPAAEAVAVT